jgi:hypothetical protein
MERGGNRQWATRYFGALALLGVLLGLATGANAQPPDSGQGQAAAKPDARPQARGQPSAAYKESLRRTVERRRQRRTLRRQGQGDGQGTLGAVVPWPMPPALVIRHTTAVHDEVGAFLYLLRR